MDNQRQIEINRAHQYLAQKDWERLDNKRELLSWVGLTALMIGLAGLALGAINLILFGSL